ncbi:MAG: glutathione S-transferase C-terminal domain-containing protein [Ezakiella massiliensis]
MNYIEFEGRKISIRPAVDDYEIDENGAYQRQVPWFREAFGEKYSNPIEKDRYTLFWAKDCAWSNRIAIIYSLLGLEKAIKEEVVDWTVLDLPVGWECVNSPNNINSESKARFIGELYYSSDSNFIGRPAVPVLYDYRRQIIANNDYENMGYYLGREFKPFHKHDAPSLLPDSLGKEIQRMGVWLYENINNGIYKMCFARNKEQYNKAYDIFKYGMENLEERLNSKRFIFGDGITDSDIRLFSTLVRLDVDYGKYLNLDIHLVDYDNLFDYSREIYQVNDVKKKIDFHKICRKEFTNEDISNVENIWEEEVNRSSKSISSDNIFFK